MTHSLKMIAILVCSLTTFIINVDNTAYQVAAPSIVNDLDVVPQVTIWIIGAFTLTLAAAELYSGWLGDNLGRRRLLLAGLSIYSAGSLLVAFSGSVGQILAGRVISGIGGAALVPMGLAILRDLSKDEEELNRFTSYWGISVGMGLASGPLIGGFFSEMFGWRGLPVVTALFSAACLILSAFIIPPVGKRDNQVDYDMVGISLLTIAVTGLTFVVVAAGTLSHVETGFTVALSGIAAAIVGLRFFLWGRDPFPSPGERGQLFLPAIIVALLNYLAFGCALFVMSVVLLQSQGGYDPGHTGILLLPVALGYSIGSRLAPVWIPRIGIALSFFAPSLLGIVASTTALILVDQFSLNWIIPCFGFCLGGVVGALNTPTNSLAMSQVKNEHAGMAGAFASTSRQVGQSLGIAVGGLTAVFVDTDGASMSIVWIPIALCFFAIGILGFPLSRKNLR